jgi:hypothetical protein
VLFQRIFELLEYSVKMWIKTWYVNLEDEEFLIIAEKHAQTASYHGGNDSSDVFVVVAADVALLLDDSNSKTDDTCCGSFNLKREIVSVTSCWEAIIYSAKKSVTSLIIGHTSSNASFNTYVIHI